MSNEKNVFEPLGRFPIPVLFSAKAVVALNTSSFFGPSEVQAVPARARTAAIAPAEDAIVNGMRHDDRRIGNLPDLVV